MVNGGIFVTKTQTLRAKGMFMPTSLETVSKNEIHVFFPFKVIRKLCMRYFKFKRKLFCYS